jgi:hypothetical protein
MHTDIFSIRPMDPKTMEYCRNDVIYLPDLREIYLGRVKPEWLTKAKEESEYRVTQAQSPGHDPQCGGKKLGPWGSGGNERILTIDQICEILEEERDMMMIWGTSMMMMNGTKRVPASMKIGAL